MRELLPVTRRRVEARILQRSGHAVDQRQHHLPLDFRFRLWLNLEVCSEFDWLDEVVYAAVRLCGLRLEQDRIARPEGEHQWIDLEAEPGGLGLPLLDRVEEPSGAAEAAPLALGGLGGRPEVQGLEVGVRI